MPVLLFLLLGVCDDATFLRRATIDLTGNIPEEAAVRAFLADSAPDKRTKLVDRLLASPEWADHFTRYWDGVLMTRAERVRAVDRAAFRDYLHQRLSENAGWDRIVRELIAAEGKSSGGGRHAKGRGVFREAGSQPADVNGAVNWILSFDRNTADLTGSTWRTFLGVQIQCAECHDHVSEKWKQTDFKAQAEYFSRLRSRRLDPEMRPVDAVFEVFDAKGKTPGRPEIAAWVTAKDNPYFAKAIVNRMWAYFLAHGFFEPFDDFREKVPPREPERLAMLASELVTHGYDLKWLMRTIMTSAEYARAPGAEGFTLRTMDLPVLLRALQRATGQDSEGLEKIERRFTFTFAVDDDSQSERRFAGTIEQALLMMNGPFAKRPLVMPDLGATPDEIVTRLFLRTVSRFPTKEELERFARGMPARQKQRAAFVEDLAWALLNSSEFAVVR